MQTITQSPQLYQSPANTNNPPVRWAGVGFRAAPTPPPGTNLPTSFFWPRTVTIIDGSSGGKVQIGDTGWIPGDFRGLQFNAQDKGIGVALTDYWNIWIAEDEDDMLSAPGSSLTAGMQYNAATGLYTSIDADAGSSNQKTANGSATATVTPITPSLIGGTGTPRGVKISNLGSANPLLVSINGVVVDSIAAGTPGQFYNVDPNSTNIGVSSAVGTNYGAIAYYGP
jgi:hypothetical protein